MTLPLDIHWNPHVSSTESLLYLIRILPLLLSAMLSTRDCYTSCVRAGSNASGKGGAATAPKMGPLLCRFTARAGARAH